MILTEKDRDQIFALAKKRSTILKQEVDSRYLSAFDAILDSYLDPEKKDQVLVGHYNNGELICIAALYGWGPRPVWTLTNVKTDPRYAHSGVQRNGIGPCFEELLKIAENQGRFKYFFVAPIRKGNEGPGLFILQKKIMALQRYEMVAEARVPRGTVPEKEFHKVMTGDRTFRVDVGIYSATLRQEFRLPHMQSSSSS